MNNISYLIMCCSNLSYKRNYYGDLFKFYFEQKRAFFITFPNLSQIIINQLEKFGILCFLLTANELPFSCY